MQIINLKWLRFLTDCQILFTFNRVQAVEDIDKLCKFHENVIMNADSIKSTRNVNLSLKMGTFPILIFHIFLKIKRVEAIVKMDKLCKFD